MKKIGLFALALLVGCGSAEASVNETKEESLVEKEEAIEEISMRYYSTELSDPINATIGNKDFYGRGGKTNESYGNSYYDWYFFSDDTDWNLCVSSKNTDYQDGYQDGLDLIEKLK